MKKLFGTLMVLALMLALLPATATAHTEGDPLVVALLAGQNMSVGYVKVRNDADTLYVKYVITDEDWCITETHLQVATSLDEIPMTKKGNPIPGKFEENDKHACVSEVKYTYNLEKKGWAPCDQQLYIAAHAVVRKTDGKGCGSTETAWGDGDPFPGANWATYFTYQVQCPCTNVPVVVNGGFEAPVVTDSFGWDIYASGTQDLGWTVEWYGGDTSFGGETRPEPAHLELHKSGTVVDASEGDQYAELDTDWGKLKGEPASVRIYQDLATCPGQVYTLSYAWSPRGGYDSKLEVHWNGAVLKSHEGNMSGWTYETWTVTASDTSTQLAFVETGTGDSYGMFLDAVSVVICEACQ